MAIGIALMFGIRLPINFMSPYKAINIIDFWRRWHMTLSRFLRDYLYFPLGGNRKGEIRRYANLMITMILGGLWHGAGWTFVLWGGLHGSFLVINHFWHYLRRLMGHELEKSSLWGRVLARSVTFLAVVVGWVYFRAENFDSANLILSTMFGFESVSVSGTTLFEGWLLSKACMLLAILSAIIWLMPNVLQWSGYAGSRDELRRIFVPVKLATLFQFRATIIWALISSAFLIYSILNLTHVSEFLYFQF
jgi:D-alanyl-lipoteichoic acid acyltransferase DltB (MBOAT superfamily)